MHAACTCMRHTAMHAHHAASSQPCMHAHACGWRRRLRCDACMAASQLAARAAATRTRPSTLPPALAALPPSAHFITQACARPMMELVERPPGRPERGGNPRPPCAHALSSPTLWHSPPTRVDMVPNCSRRSRAVVQHTPMVPPSSLTHVMKT
jgi:hypothetical protein